MEQPLQKPAPWERPGDAWNIVGNLLNLNEIRSKSTVFAPSCLGMSLEE